MVRESSTLRRDETKSFWASAIAVALGAGFLGGLGLIIRRYRRARTAMQAAELTRLEELVVTDPLTGLRNHRAFHEDLAREIQRTARTGSPLALVMFDVDDLKAINDDGGHRAGDKALKTLADAFALSQRATDRAYRIGGDEFALLLPAAREWAAFQFVHRLNATLASLEGGPAHVTAGVAQALDLCSKDDLVHDADLALMSARSMGQDVAIYSLDMEPRESTASDPAADHHTRTLASALALAVDAKDSYTRSHCQTVATLCVVVAAELGLEPGRVTRIRLAGLLHDVGKIGIPDAILKKPAVLTPEEYELMKTHSVLGEGIVIAAEMPIEARWVRHHHERIDGAGYPDGLVGGQIPLESRIIHVADAFEAMTSDRPYRDAPGERFAIEELRRFAGTQFDADVVDALVRVVGDPSLRRALSASEAVASPGREAAVGV